MIGWTAIRREPFRVLFPLGMLFGILGVGRWLLYAAGVQPAASGSFHALTQIGGFMLCFIAGFLMTMLPRFAAAPAASTAELLSLLGGVATLVWAAGQQWWMAAELLFTGILLLLACFVGRRISSRRTGGAPPVEFIWIGVGLLHGLLGVAFMTAGRIGAPVWMAAAGRPLLLQGTVLAMVTGVAGFMAPRLMGHPVVMGGPDVSPVSLQRRRLQRHAMAALLFLASFLVEGAGAVRAAYLLRAAVVTAVLATSTRCYRIPRAQDLYVWFLWASLWLILAGLWGAGLWPRYRVTLLHLVFIGGLSLMIFSVATMVVLSHAGQGHRLRGWLWVLPVIGIGVLGAITSRLAADLHPAAYNLLIGMAAACWIIPAAAWLIFSAPHLVRQVPEETFDQGHEEAKRRLRS